jgi:hypothetical protein
MAKFYIVRADGTKVPFEGFGMLANVEQVTVDKTLTVEDSGKTFILNGATDGAEILLPPVFNGMYYKFKVGANFATTDWTIVSTTNVIQGHALVAGAPVVAVNENTISFVSTVESVGDYVEIESDGTNIYVNGSAVTALSITFTAP